MWLEITPEPSTSGNMHLSPEFIRPFPKAKPRKFGSRGGKRPGRCRILTDTPEKQEIEEQEAIKNRKNEVKKKPNVKRKLREKSSSSSSQEEVLESDDSLEDVEWGLREESEKEEELDTNLKENDYVLVKLCSKKTCRFYVAKIIEHSDGKCQTAVKYLKKKAGNKFICDDETVYDIQLSDVVLKLPAPYTVGGTERRNRELQFSVDFSTYAIE